MTRMDGMTDRRDPWRAFVTVSQIPDNGLHRDIEADSAARAAMAELAGLREISSARASFDITLMSGGRVHVAGRVQALIGQTCIVTLDPIKNEIDEAVDLIFAPAEQLADLVDVDDAGEREAEIVDQPEPFENGVIDLGRLATDVLFLAIDPYPRKPGAVFEPQVVAADPQDHPFAALKTLKIDPEKPDTGKPKRK
jgi:Large ribosomal RNA subunit accumulation protein YceD